MSHCGVNRLRTGFGVIFLAVMIFIFLAYQAESMRKPVSAIGNTLRSLVYQDEGRKALGVSNIGDSRQVNASAQGGLPLTYLNRRTFNTSVKFSLKTEYLLKLGLPPKRFMTLTEDNVKNFVFVTGCSSNHFNEIKDAVGSVQQFFPNQHILFIDYGLTKQQSSEVQKWCQVEVKKFDFTPYPSHVRNMKYYAWKMLTLLCLFSESPDTGIFWMDASVRFKRNDLTVPFAMALENGGLVHTMRASFNIIFCTHPKLYTYFPTDMEQMKTMGMVPATSFLVYNTRKIYEGILHWAYLCALEKNCIAPTKALICRVTKILPQKWVGCHRFDQSLLNVLDANFFNFNTTVYDSGTRHHLIKATRRPTHFHQLRMCH